MSVPPDLDLEILGSFQFQRQRRGEEWSRREGVPVDGERRNSRGQGRRGGPRRRRWRRDRATARRPWRRWSWSQLATADGRRAQRPEDEATSCGRRRRAGAGGAVASRGWLGLLAKRPPNPTQTLGCAGLKPEASRSPILGPRATKSRPSTRLPVFLSNFSVVLASGSRRHNLLPSRRRGELRSENILYCSAKGT